MNHHSDHHINAALAQLTDEERAFYGTKHAAEWLAQMAPRLAPMEAAEAAEMLRAEMPALRAAEPPAGDVPVVARRTTKGA